MNEVTKTAIAAMAASLVWAFMLMAIIYSAIIGPATSLIWILKFTALLVCTAVVIFRWMKYLRAYVTNALEKRLGEMSSPASTPTE